MLTPGVGFDLVTASWAPKIFFPWLLQAFSLCTGPFPVGDTDWPISSCGYKIAPL